MRRCVNRVVGRVAIPRVQGRPPVDDQRENKDGEQAQDREEQPLLEAVCVQEHHRVDAGGLVALVQIYELAHGGLCGRLTLFIIHI